jgi:Permuted papain-like amidase enzyme, YaeF/YiiX, C92 family
MRKGSGSEGANIPTTAYRFRWEALQPGDVICSTIPDARVSKLIRALTRSSYSHVSICVEEKGCIEANESVARFSLLHVGCHDPKNVKVLRLRDDADPNARRIQLAAGSNALNFLGQPYWTSGAFRSLFRWLPPTEQPGAFCSHLVASAYREAGLEIVPAVSPQHITPQDIAECPLFEDISDTILEVIPAAHIESYFEYVDDERAVNTPHLCEIAIGLSVCDDIADDFESLVGARPRSLLEAQKLICIAQETNPAVVQQLDLLLCSALRKHNFAEEMIRVMPRKPLYDPDQMVAWLLSDGATPFNVGHVFKACTDLRAGSETRLQERLSDWQTYQMLADSGLSSFVILAKVCEEAYETYKRLIETNDLCIKILFAYQTNTDFARLAPGGDPFARLTRAGEAEGTFVFLAVTPASEARKYVGRLADCLLAYVLYLGTEDSGIGVSVWQETEGNGLVFVPPPPLDEGSWLIKPCKFDPSKVQDHGPAKAPSLGRNSPV